MGDFYETFDEDAEVVARDLEIALTSREFGKGERVPLAGIPYHSLDTYLGRLIRCGHRVALCEQTSDPSTSKGLVDREVVRVVTPGTVVEDSILDPTANSYLAAVFPCEGQVGLAYADITTSEFATGQVAAEGLADELARLDPAEVLVPEGSGPGNRRAADRRSVAGILWPGVRDRKAQATLRCPIPGGVRVRGTPAGDEGGRRHR